VDFKRKANEKIGKIVFKIKKSPLIFGISQDSV